jgi:hypothetical protein
MGTNFDRLTTEPAGRRRLQQSSTSLFGKKRKRGHKEMSEEQDRTCQKVEGCDRGGGVVV